MISHAKQCSDIFGPEGVYIIVTFHFQSTQNKLLLIIGINMKTTPFSQASSIHLLHFRTRLSSYGRKMVIITTRNTTPLKNGYSYQKHYQPAPYYFYRRRLQIFQASPYSMHLFHFRSYGGEPTIQWSWNLLSLSDKLGSFQEHWIAGSPP